jgi:hypothetical protein
MLEGSWPENWFLATLIVRRFLIEVPIELGSAPVNLFVCIDLCAEIRGSKVYGYCFILSNLQCLQIPEVYKSGR